MQPQPRAFVSCPHLSPRFGFFPRGDSGICLPPASVCPFLSAHLLAPTRLKRPRTTALNAPPSSCSLKAPTRGRCLATNFSILYHEPTTKNPSPVQRRFVCVFFEDARWGRGEEAQGNSSNTRNTLYDRPPNVRAQEFSMSAPLQKHSSLPPSPPPSTNTPSEPSAEEHAHPLLPDSPSFYFIRTRCLAPRLPQKSSL